MPSSKRTSVEILRDARQRLEEGGWYRGSFGGDYSGSFKQPRPGKGEWDCHCPVTALMATRDSTSREVSFLWEALGSPPITDPVTDTKARLIYRANDAQTDEAGYQWALDLMAAAIRLAEVSME